MSARQHRYTVDAVRSALSAIRDDNVPIKHAARIHNIPTSTLRDKLFGKSAEDNISKRGPGCLLGIELERKLLNWIHDCGTRGLVLFRSTVLKRVRELIDENPRIKMKTTEDFPSRSWFYSFLRRHPEIVEQHPQLFARQSKTRKDDANLASDSEIEFISCETVDLSNAVQSDVVVCPKTRQDEVEELLPSWVVDLFRSCYEEHGDEWVGPVAHTTAYSIWLKAKKEILGGRPKSGKGRKPKLNRVRRKKLKR